MTTVLPIYKSSTSFGTENLFKCTQVNMRIISNIGALSFGIDSKDFTEYLRIPVNPLKKSTGGSHLANMPDIILVGTNLSIWY